MSLQYITDSEGKATGVFIPIDEWDKLKKRIDGYVEDEAEIPEWQKNVVRERMESYKKSPSDAQDFDSAMDGIEENL